jgi:uncharacterized Ntn-hydrolase superfamily protein
MTLSIAARCARTGMLGAAVTSSSIAVASRCAHARAGVGAALTRAAGAEDGDSVAFLTRRYVAQPDRRLAICFARRLARAAA